MFVFADLLAAIIDPLLWLLGLLELIIFVRVLLSWVNADPYNPLVRTLVAIAEPFLRPFRKLLPPWRFNGLDLSPILAVISIEVVRRFVGALLWDIVNRLR